MRFEINNLYPNSGAITIGQSAEVRSYIKRRGTMHAPGIHGDHVKRCVKREEFE